MRVAGGQISNAPGHSAVGLDFEAVTKTAAAEGGIKEKRKFRFRPGTVAIREIKKY